LKSTASVEIFPETWLPTSTLTTALNVPLAVTCCTMSPRVAATVSNFAALPPDGLQPEEMAAIKTTASATRELLAARVQPLQRCEAKAGVAFRAQACCGS
jgi:hypothetical protein